VSSPGMPLRLAVLVDGEYAKKVLQRLLRRFPTHEDVMVEVHRMLGHPDLTPFELYRILYYTAEPLAGVTSNPLSGVQVVFDRTATYSRNKRLIDSIENQADVAVRRGTLVHQGWEIGRAALRALTSGSKTSVAPDDLVPKIQQKGVDMRIGLDIASLALKRLVSTIVIVTGDADLVPAMRLARREGLRVYLDTIGQSHVRPELKKHADRVMDRG
jgi:uncharacterized LabA/DUF88 family protein